VYQSGRKETIDFVGRGKGSSAEYTQWWRSCQQDSPVREQLASSFSLGQAGERATGHKAATPEYPSWSPDGKMIVFASGGEIQTVRVDGNTLRKLTDKSLNCSSGCWDQKCHGKRALSPRDE
jgi:hypothetical protein